MENAILKSEKTKLQQTIDVLKDARHGLEKAMAALGMQNLAQLKELRDDPVTSGTDFLMFVQQLHEKNEAFNVKDKVKRMEELDYLANEPYFARLDLCEPNSKTTADTETVYIGKFGFTDERTPLITDWRAKIASLYYRYRYPQKNVKYETIEGEIVKDLTLKRTYEIDRGELIKYYNNDIQFDEDELIAGKIEERTGGVLEDIIETIQESQLDIIESDPRKICIVQGCVGSGKSTVAIHKLSHTFFNYPNLVQPDRAILVAKSGVLVSYLATLFPKLGIFDISYKTLRELVVNVVFREEMSIEYDLDAHSDLAEFSLADIKRLEKVFDAIHTEYATKIEKILDNDEFASFSSFVYSRNQSVKENINEFIADLTEELDFQKAKLKDDPKAAKSWIYRENVVNLRKLIKNLQAIKQNLKTKTLPAVCKKWQISLNAKLGYLETLIYIYMHSELFGLEKSLKYQYCVVDEGQDFSPLEYLILGKVVQNGRFCILGDLNQSYFNDGLSDWDMIKEVITEAKEAETFELTTNYRSTAQIIKFANEILKPYTEKYLPMSIDRNGPEPKIHAIHQINDIKRAFAQDLENEVMSLNKSIGIICFTQEDYDLAEQVLSNLQTEQKIPASAVIKLDDKKRVSYIPKGVYLSMFEVCKGLEFSKVYVLGLDLTKVTDFQTAKKAFVAVTRAMTELSIYC